MSRKPLDQDLYDSVVEEAKRKFAVWPSAYASGWVVKTYKDRGGRYGGESKGARTGLTKWFGESWVDLSRPIREDGEVVGYEPCGRKKSDDPADYPKCRPAREAMRMTPEEVRDAVRRKRRAEASAGERGSRARAPVRVATYKNPMRQPEDAPGFRLAAIEHTPERIILAAYTDDGKMLAWIAARAEFLLDERTKRRGVRRAAFPDLSTADEPGNVVWAVEGVDAFVDGWGPFIYEMLLTFVAEQGYSGWVVADTMSTSGEADRVWQRFSARDDVEFLDNVGRNARGEAIPAMRARDALFALRAPLLAHLDTRPEYLRAVRQFQGFRDERLDVRENPLMLDSIDDPLEPEFRRTIASLEPTRLALVYHGTSTTAFWPIVTSGLSFDVSRKAWEGTSPGVFVAFDQSATDVYASRATQTFGGTPICFVLEVPYDWLDTDIDDYLTHDKTRKAQAMVHKPIPSSRIVGVMLPEGMSWGPEIPIKRFVAAAKKGEYESIGITPPAKGKRFKLGAATRIDLEHVALNYLVDLIQYTSLADVLLQPEWGSFQRKTLQALVSIPRTEWLTWNGRKWLAFAEGIIGAQNEEPYAEQMLEEPRFKRSIGAVLSKYGFDDLDRDRILGG